MRVGILNVTGYAGAELARILHRHPDVEVISVTGRSAAGKRLAEVFPHLADMDMPITAEVEGEVDLVFSALPHAASAQRLEPYLTRGVPVVDLSADFRLRDLAVYQEWYGVEHPCPQFLEEAVYGLPELYRHRLAGARLVAVPGCYPTAALLALAPALKAGIVEPEFIVDAKSGVSGAGRGLSLKTHFSEVNESVSAYAVDGHRHMPEIAQELSAIQGDGAVKLTFMPHLIPMTRGILATCYAPLKAGALPPGERARQEVADIYRSVYEGEPFVKVVPSAPATKHTLGNNDCLVYPTVDPRTERLVVISCIDNLVKGAAGQAVQCMNALAGLPETRGLEALALYP